MDNNLLQIKQIDQNSRGLFIKLEVKSWQTIIDCDPICTSISIKYRNRFCSSCLLQKKVDRCSACKVLHYCSKQCQKQDWKIHKHECKALKKLQIKNLDPSKINMEMLLNLRIWIIRNNNQLINEQIDEMCSLVQFQLPQKLSQYQQTAVMLSQLLDIQRNQQNMSYLIKQQCTIGLNCFTIQDYLCNQSSIGLGIYWPVNFINHHCHPNCTQIFDGKYLKIVANRKIEPGEQLTISYMPTLDTWANKQKFCREGYLFECFCQQCQVNKMFDQTLMYIKCPYCQDFGINDKNRKKNTIQNTQQQQQNQKKQPCYQCRNCKKQIPKAEINQIIQKANSLLLKIQSTQNNYDTVKKALLQFRKIISNLDPRMKDCIYRVYDQSLTKAAQDKKYYTESYILLKQMLELIPKWYRMNPQDQIPYIYVWRYAQLGKISYFLQKFKKACEYTEKAYQIISKIKFRNSFTEVKQLKQRYDEMKIGLSFNKAEIFRKNQY